jgi:hypothetical protein
MTVPQWMYEGLQEQNALDDAPWIMDWIGKGVDKANLKTKCMLQNSVGKIIPSKLVNPNIDEPSEFPIHTWNNIPEDSTIIWDAQTIPCDDEAGSDRLEIEILTLDYVLLAQLTNDIIADWSVEEIEEMMVWPQVKSLCLIFGRKVNISLTFTTVIQHVPNPQNLLNLCNF